MQQATHTASPFFARLAVMVVSLKSGVFSPFRVCVFVSPLYPPLLPGPRTRSCVREARKTRSADGATEKEYGRQSDNPALSPPERPAFNPIFPDSYIQSAAARSPKMTNPPLLEAVCILNLPLFFPFFFLSLFFIVRSPSSYKTLHAGSRV